jgi:hypothetical protein
MGPWEEGEVITPADAKELVALHIQRIEEILSGPSPGGAMIPVYVPSKGRARPSTTATTDLLKAAKSHRRSKLRCRV